MGLHVYLQPDERRAVEDAAESYGMSQSAIVRYAIRAFLGLPIPRRFRMLADELELAGMEDE